MTSLPKKVQKTSSHFANKIQQLKEKQRALETKMVQLLHRALKIHQGFSLPFSVLMGGFIDVMEQAKTNSNQAEAWNVAGGKFLRQRNKQHSKIPSAKNSSAVSKSPAAMENTHDQA
ncbi:MAG: hypothetical protein ACH349_02025 [Candidatus Rhabdochlamydia sp.]|nr:hypothetical protein [Alphaproteobacteria bacterium]